MDTNVPVWAVSLVGGGLAGGCVNIIYNRWIRQRDMRTKFFPIVNNIFSAYTIRMENKEGRYWETVVGMLPSEADEAFVKHRTAFVHDLVQFNELKEARILRKEMLDSMMEGKRNMGDKMKTDLMPEYRAIGTCFNLLHKKLNL